MSLLEAIFSSFLPVISFTGFQFLSFDDFPWTSLLLWTFQGLIVSLMACFCAWPFSLSLVSLLRQYNSNPLTGRVFKFIHFSASLPLILFVCVFMEVLGPDIFILFKDFLMDQLARENLLTKAIAFVLTIFLFPIFQLFSPSETGEPDLFFRETLVGVIDFFQMTLLGGILVFILTVFLIPRMTVTMEKSLLKNREISGFEVIQSLGGSHWESVSIAMLQFVKDHSKMILARFVRICFFESLITFSILKFFLSFKKGPWGSTLSERFIFESLKVTENHGSSLLVLAGYLVFVYLFILQIETYYSKSLFKDKMEIF